MPNHGAFDPHEAQDEATSARRALPLLDDIAIATPCFVDWNSMVGDERVRFCGECQKQVYNLSNMNADEAEALVREREGDLCARLYRRADGTVLTADCPKGTSSQLGDIPITTMGMVAPRDPPELHLDLDDDVGVPGVRIAIFLALLGGLVAALYFFGGLFRG